jgi:hypothetical protein
VPGLKGDVRSLAAARRPDTIPRHKSGKARMQAPLWVYWCCGTRGPLFDSFVRRGRSRHEVEQFHIRFCFPDTAIADAFRNRFGGECLTYTSEALRSIAMSIVRFTGNRIALLASITADIVIYLVLGLLWPFAAACAVILGLIWVASERR